MDSSSLLAELPKAVPVLLGTVIGGLIGVIIQYVTNRLTRRREAKKLLREKAEELIHTLYQHRDRFRAWRNAIVRQVEQDAPSLEEYESPILLGLDRAYTLQRLYFP
jgi:hypothetical protein